MSKHVVTVGLDSPLSHIKAIFEENHFHHLLVVENNTLLGVISDRDLLKALSPKVDMIAATVSDLATLNKKAHQIMTRKPECLNLSATIKDAIAIFNQHKISCIPIIDDRGKPVGIVSWRDIMRVLVNLKSSTD